MTEIDGRFYFQKYRAEDTAKVPIIGAPFGKIHTGILTLFGNCYFQLILLAIFQ